MIDRIDPIIDLNEVWRNVADNYVFRGKDVAYPLIPSVARWVKDAKVSESSDAAVLRREEAIIRNFKKYATGLSQSPQHANEYVLSTTVPDMY